VKGLGDVEVEGCVLLSCNYHAGWSERNPSYGLYGGLSGDYIPTALTLIVRYGERMRYHWKIPKISFLELGYDGTQQMGWLNDA